MTDASERQTFDAIVIGSGFGGAMAAHVLVHAGWRVLMLERGDWVPRGPQIGARVALDWYRRSTRPRSSYRGAGGTSRKRGRGPVLRRRPLGVLWRCFPAIPRSRLYAGSFHPRGVGGALAVSLCRARAFLHPRGAAARRGGHDGRGPGRAAAQCTFPASPAPLAPLSLRLSDAARRSDCTRAACPWRSTSAARCVACDACDGFACAVSAKNDSPRR